jgi:fatty-acyl-CoA synthase
VVTMAHRKPEMAAAASEVRTHVVTRAGFPAPLVRVRIADAEGHPLPPGREHPGEVTLRSPWLTPGYFKSVEQSQQLWRNGWLHTGDVGYIDEEGYVRITDRFKDVIKIGGEWMSTLELENALCKHPSVADVAVVAVPDDKWGECPHAEIVLHEAFRDQVKATDLLAHLRQFVEAGSIHKRAILTHFRFVPALPRTSVGKLDKKRLRSQIKNDASV